MSRKSVKSSEHGPPGTTPLGPAVDPAAGVDLGHLPYDPSRVLVVAGPTSAGKTSLVAEMGQFLALEVVCMDSMQLYRELAIGTGRPSELEQAGIPHHLFGEFSVSDPMTAVRYARLAGDRIAAIQAKGRTALLVGGTGLYMKTLFEGAASLPQTPPRLRTRLEHFAIRHGRSWLYKMLTRLDPAGAAHLHPNDSQRIQRFLEVRLLTGKGILTHWSAEAKAAGQRVMPVAIGLEVPRELLLARIEGRVHAMIAQGWVAETERLLEQGNLPEVLETGPIGYHQIAAFLAGESSYEEMVEKIIFATRRYAKRQMTWFRKTSYIQWFPFTANSGYNKVDIFDFVKGKMSKTSHSDPSMIHQSRSPK